jgi:branched-chain amino acid transport system permease protein
VDIFFLEDLFWEQVIVGLSTGGIYALVALAIVLIYRSTEVINFAQGEMAMFTTLVAWSLWQADVPYPLMILAIVALGAALGGFVELAVLRRVAGAPHLTIIIVTIGLFAIFSSMAGVIWEYDPKTFPALIDGNMDVGPATLPRHQLATLGAALAIMVVLYLFFRFTSLGLAMRATAQNPLASRLMGIRVGRMLTLGWALSATAGAVAGLLVAPIVISVSPNMMLPILLYAFAAAVLGGLDSPLGALVGGLSIGVMENLAGTYWIGPELKQTFVLGIIVLVLVVRPTGLFGRRAITRV